MAILQQRNPQNLQPSQRYCLWSTDLPSSKDGLPPQLSHSSLTRAASLRMPSTMWEHTWQKKPHTECTGKEEVVLGSWHPVTHTENWLVKLVFIKSTSQCQHWSKNKTNKKLDKFNTLMSRRQQILHWKIVNSFKLPHSDLSVTELFLSHQK